LDLFNSEKEDENYECERIDIFSQHRVADEHCGIFELTIPIEDVSPGVLLNVNGKLRNKDNRTTIPANSNLMPFGSIRIPVPKKVVDPKPSAPMLSSPPVQKKVDLSTFVLFQVEYDNDKKDVSINRSALTITHLEEQVRSAFGIDESTELKFQSKARDGNITIEKKFETDQMVAVFDSRSQFISVKLGKKKEKDDKIKVFLLTPDGKRVKYMMKKTKTSLKEFRDEVRSKIKSTNDNFTVEITTGKNASKKIATDSDVANCLNDGDEVKITL